MKTEDRHRLEEAFSATKNLRRLDEPALRSLARVVGSIEAPDDGDAAYSKLRRAAASLFASEMYVEADASTAYSLGAVWGLVEASAMVFSRDFEAAEECARGDAVKKYERILRVLEDYPDLTHNELAEKCGQKKSRLSQIMHHLVDLKLVSVLRSGRSKHYRLTRCARNHLSRLPEQTLLVDYLYMQKGTLHIKVSAENAAGVIEDFKRNNSVNALTATEGAIKGLDDGRQLSNQLAFAFASPIHDFGNKATVHA